ncbi:protein Wiz-like isoform X1 [Acipenser ruthenus]|uniref:protein Wiz-like isoform X1 n=1 Tax=Acipenser ruthenus TaxID=7906 RepID=UPI0027413E73|nr:protein Wiz-like isoform X1 [Acipenser ruthenus]
MEKGVPEPGPAAQRGGPPTTGGASHHSPGEDGPGGKAGPFSSTPARRDASWQGPQEAEDRPGSGTAGEPRAELGPHRRAQPSAFPSAQAWDSDSEKETLEEEELQHFSNPHGLASHSPEPLHKVLDVWQKPIRPDSEGSTAPEHEHLLTTLSNSPGTKGLRGGSEQHPRSNSTSPSPSGEQEEEGSSRTTPVTSKHLSSGTLRSATRLEEPDPESETSRDVKAAATDDPKSTKINDATSSQGRTNEEGEGEPEEEVWASPVKMVFPETAKPKDEKEHLGKERWGRASPCSGSSEATSEPWLETGEEEDDVYSFPRSDRGSPPSLSWPPSTFPETRKQVPSMRAGTAGGTEREEEEEDEEEEEQEEEELGAIVTNKPSRPSPEKSSLKGESRTPNWDSRDPISKGTASAASRSAGSGFEVGGGRYGYSISAEELRGREEDEDDDEDGGEEIEEEALSDEAEQSVFTCVECSIYFKKQVHLQEHMLQHCRAQQGREGGAAKEGAGSEGGGAGAGAGEFCCPECGWEFEDRGSLGQHRRRHQESREKIMEEIQKLNEFPDEGSEPRLHCPKCRFGTNSSKVFVEHAKMHIKERNEQARDRGYQPSPLGLYRPVNPSSAIPHLPLKERYACQICSFPAPNESILREHMKYTHSHRLPWGMDQPDESEESLPGTSKDSYSLAKPYPSPTKTPSIPSFDGVRFGPSSGLKTRAVVVRDSPFRTQTPILGGPFGQRSLGVPTALKGGPYRPSVQQGPDSHQPLPKRKEVAFKSIGNRRSHAMPAHPGMGSPSGLSWPDSGLENRETQEMGGDEASSGSEFEDHVDIWFPEQLEVPQRALELKWEFREELRSAGESLGQQDQLRRMVPMVVLETLNLLPRIPQPFPLRKPGPKSVMEARRLEWERAVRSRMHSSSSSPPLLEHLLSCHPGDDCFLDDFQEEGAGSEPGALRSVERKCPYCPDRFHNGIGLANHVRGHLNRVGVSYNVRHFISPEEVNAIEQKFSYQKKKKKVANFDPDTFSLMRCEFCSAGFDTRAGLSSHARAHLRDFGITNWELTVSPINILRNLFSSRPDLAFPRDAAPPHSPQEQEPAEEGPGSGGSPPRSPFTSPWREEPGSLFSEGGEEDDMSAVEVPSPETGVRSETVSQGEPSGSAARVGPKPPAEAPGGREDPQDIKPSNLLTCAVCSVPFETRKGLSSHARSHLRHLGVAESESSGAPIDLLYELMKQRGKLEPLPPPQSSAAKKQATSAGATGATATKGAQEPKLAKLGSPAAFSPKAMAPSPSPVLKKAPVSSLLPSASPLGGGEQEKGVKPAAAGTPGATTPKPFWAPQEDDAPLNLTVDLDANKDIVCQLCGAWFETRKGLSSHARAHLRHFGVVDAETKGSPIDYLHELIKRDDFKKRLSSLQPLDASPPPPLKRPGPPRGSTLPPPAKKPKRALQMFRLPSGQLSPITHNTLKEIGCEFCGEYFENRKGLSSHARSHLRQLGITEWTVNGSPIDTLRELIKRKGLPSALPSPQPPTPPAAGHKLLPKPQRHLSHPPRPRLPPPPSTPAPGSPSPSPRSPTHSTPPSSSPSHSPSPSLLRKLPFGLGQARKMLTSLKPEPVCLELGRERGVGGFHNDSLQGHRGWAGPDSILPLNLVADREPVRDIRCEFCGEYFENRKGLSSHSRSHLRQMGITEWTVNGSPIDTLREIMHKKGKPLIIKKEPGTGAGYRGPPWEERGGYHQQHKPYGSPSPSSSSSSSNKPQLQSSPPRLMKPGLGSTLASREVSLSPINGRAQGGFLSPLAKRPLQDGRSPPGASGEPLRQQGGGSSSSKSYVQTELSFKPKALSSPEKPAAAHMLPDASCELCGFYFENRKALASHARAHLRQFGVTEWCVNGSPIETLSAWMRSKPHKVAEVHRTYMQGGGPYPKKMRAASLPSAELDSSPSAVQRSPVGRQTPGTPLGKRVSRELGRGHWEMGRGPECGGVGVPGSPTSPVLHDLTTQHQLLHQQQQGARSELNIRSPRGFERRPLKHPAHLEGDEALERCPTAPRVRTIPSLVPKPPATPLVKILGNTYCLKCRFCDVQFVGPLSMQEDWIRHLQQHILEMNFPKSVPPLEESSPPAESTDTAAQVL